MNGLLLTIGSLIVVLGVLVFIHELGHFLAAKWAGIRVLRFSVGMGKPIKALTRVRGGTEYTISWLPLGGYVKMASREEMAGDALEGGAVDIADVPESETFEAQPVWKRMVVILAGVTLNVLFAWFVFSGVYFGAGRPTLPTTTIGFVSDSALPAGAEALRSIPSGTRVLAAGGREVESWEDILEGIQDAPGDSVVLVFEGGESMVLPLHRDALKERVEAATALQPYSDPIIGALVEGSPAARAGLAEDDTVLSVNGAPVSQWHDMVGYLDTLPGAEVRLMVGRAGGRQEVVLTTALDTVVTASGESKTVGRIGAWNKTPPLVFVPLGFAEAVAAGGRTTLGTTTLIVRLVRGMVTGRVSAREVGGPIMIAQSAAASVRRGWIDFLMFMALISVNLAVVNLLPVPVLDGGQFLFLVGEAILRKPLPMRLRQGLTAFGLLLVGLLMVLAISNDLFRIFQT